MLLMFFKREFVKNVNVSWAVVDKSERWIKGLNDRLHNTQDIRG